MKNIKRFLAPLLLILLFLPSAAMAQNWEDMGIESNLDVNYGEWNLFFCLSATGIQPGCLSDITEARQDKAQSRSIGRYLRAGVVALTEIWGAVEAAKSTWDDLKVTVDIFESIFDGFDWQNPQYTVYKLRYAVQRFDRNVDKFERVQSRIPEFGFGDRYKVSESVVTRALATAKDAEIAATTMTDQGGVMQRRLAGEDAEAVVVDVGGGTTGGSFGDTPPLPSDAPADANQIYAVATSEGGALAGVASQGGVRRVGQGGMVMAQLSAPQRAAGEEGDVSVCEIEGLDVTDPAVMIQRVMAQANAAHTQADIISSDVGTAREQVRAVRMQEEEHQQMGRIMALMHLISTM